MAHGLCYRIVIWLSRGCRLLRKSSRVWTMKTHTLTSDSGSPATHQIRFLSLHGDVLVISSATAWASNFKIYRLVAPGSLHVLTRNDSTNVKMCRYSIMFKLLLLTTVSENVDVLRKRYSSASFYIVQVTRDFCHFTSEMWSKWDLSRRWVALCFAQPHQSIGFVILFLVTCLHCFINIPLPH